MNVTRGLVVVFISGGANELGYIRAQLVKPDGCITVSGMAQSAVLGGIGAIGGKFVNAFIFGRPGAMISDPGLVRANFSKSGWIKGVLGGAIGSGDLLRFF